MSTASFIEKYHDRYTDTKNEPSILVSGIDINLPDELGDNLTVPNDESLLWFKIALIRYHVKQL
jgi:hypothetical protein